jgi:hypothetical protein
MSAGNLSGKGLNFSARNGVASGVASGTPALSTTAITIPGLTSSSVVFASTLIPDNGAGLHYICSAVPTTDTLSIRFNTFLNTPTTTAKVAWFVAQY